MNININRMLHKSISPGVGKMAQWLEELAALLEDPGLIPSIPMAAQLSVTPAPGIPTSSSVICGHCTQVCTKSQITSSQPI